MAKDKDMLEFDEIEVNYLLEALEQYNWDRPDLDGDERQFYLQIHKDMKKKMLAFLDGV